MMGENAVSHIKCIPIHVYERRKNRLGLVLIPHESKQPVDYLFTITAGSL